MFQTDLTHLQSKLHLSSSPSSHHLTTPTHSGIDLQYELYSRYLHLSKQQIAIQQLMLMKDSQNLIESINLTAKNDTSRDAHSTLDSLCYDDDLENSLVHQFSAIEKRSPKKITRKSTRQSILKPHTRSVDQFAEILSEIERNCTQKTFTTVKNIISEHKKNLIKMNQVEKKYIDHQFYRQKNIRRLQEKSQKTDQQNAIFRVKLAEIEQKMKSKEEQIKCLKEKLNQLKTIDKQNIRSQKRLLSSSFKSIPDEQRSHVTLSPQNPTISLYLDKKQSSLKNRMTKVQQIQARIQHLIETSVTGQIEQSQESDSCGKCCHMIRKIKESVMKYRQYLEEEGDQCEKLYNMLKAEVEHCLTDRKAEISNC